MTSHATHWVRRGMLSLVGEEVYSVGSPRELEISLSDGIVSQLRGSPPPFIQSTAPVTLESEMLRRTLFLDGGPYG